MISDLVIAIFNCLFGLFFIISSSGGGFNVVISYLCIAKLPRVVTFHEWFFCCWSDVYLVCEGKEKRDQNRFVPDHL